MTKHLRAGQRDQQKGKVQWVEQNGHRLVPAQYHHGAVDPVRDLRNARDCAALGFHIVSISVFAELIGEIERLGLAKHDKRRGEIKFV